MSSEGFSLAFKRSTDRSVFPSSGKNLVLCSVSNFVRTAARTTVLMNVSGKYCDINIDQWQSHYPEINPKN